MKYEIGKDYGFGMQSEYRNLPKFTVADLISALQGMPPDRRVVCHGGEGGYDDVTGVDVVDLKLNVHKECYCGDHEKSEEGKVPDETAVVI